MNQKCLLYVGFLAVNTDSRVGIPFFCMDYYGEISLMFSPEGPDEATRRAIGQAFWTLLLSAPDDLADFKTTIYHVGGDFYMHFSCQNGEPNYEESEDDLSNDEDD